MSMLTAPLFGPNPNNAFSSNIGMGVNENDLLEIDNTFATHMSGHE